MSQDDAKVFLSLADFVLQQDVLLTALSKSFLLRFQCLEDVSRLRAEIDRLPAGAERQSALDQFSALVLSSDATERTRLLTDLLAARESAHEQLEAFVERLRASLPPDSGTGLP